MALRLGAGLPGRSSKRGRALQPVRGRTRPAGAQGQCSGAARPHGRPPPAAAAEPGCLSNPARSSTITRVQQTGWHVLWFSRIAQQRATYCNATHDIEPARRTAYVYVLLRGVSARIRLPMTCSAVRNICTGHAGIYPAECADLAAEEIPGSLSLRKLMYMVLFRIMQVL